MNYANKDDVERLLFKSDVSIAQIAKATGIRDTALGKYKRGESVLGNMSLDNAIKLQNYYLKLEEESKLTDKMSREEVFGRSLAALDIISERCFEKGKPHAAIKYQMQGFDQKPMTVYFRAHKDIMDYSKRFKEIDLALLDRINSYIGSMDPADYNDEPLEPVHLIYISKESVLLRELIKNKQLLIREEEQ